MRTEINFRLRRARVRQLWTIKQAAARVGVSPQTYIRWELGTQLPHLSSLDLLCQAFRARPEDLGFGELVNVKEDRVITG
jgi:transcriptional regulator with XRE-family HTH domain